MGEDDGAVGSVLLSELDEVWIGVWAADGALSTVIEAFVDVKEQC